MVRVRLETDQSDGRWVKGDPTWQQLRWIKIAGQHPPGHHRGLSAVLGTGGLRS
jgi:hypothetical protein